MKGSSGRKIRRMITQPWKQRKVQRNLLRAEVARNLAEPERTLRERALDFLAQRRRKVGRRSA